MRLRVFFIFISTCSFGQLVQVPIEHKINGIPSQHRRTDLTAMPLPFWDDFSFTRESGFANDTLWEISKSARVSTGLSVDPPSLFSAAFDGIDSLGKPYNLTDILAKGRADRMISRKIRLDLVPQQERSTVFFSFYYQIRGKGEAPDQDDNFSLWWLDNTGVWQNVFETGRSENPDPLKFNYVILPVSDEKFYHDKFQFRFQNFSRLSGPYDMWHLDYVYINKNRTSSERSMPDRTVSSKLTSPFKGYYSIPLHHLKDVWPVEALKPSIRLFGLLENNFQPFTYTTLATIRQISGGQTTESIVPVEEDAVPVNPSTGATEIIEPFTMLNLNLKKTFPGSQIDYASDSVYIKLKFILDSEDDNPLVYLPKYRPINFLSNDTSAQEFSLASYYSRDDGEAEFGAGLNQPGTELAYGFDLLYPQPDTVVAVDLYFPEFGDQSNQNLVLKIWNGGPGGPVAQLHQQNLQVIRSTGNSFIRYRLTEPVIVENKFFVGWKQNSSAVIPVGLDKNNDSGSEMYFNVTGTWEQNSIVTGSLMIRPVFGSGNGTVINNAADETKPLIFPNPSAGQLYFPGNTTQIKIFDAAGRAIQFSEFEAGGKKIIEVTRPATGYYIVQWMDSGKIRRTGIIIRKD
jgi:hypothetical protein